MKKLIATLVLLAACTTRQVAPPATTVQATGSGAADPPGAVATFLGAVKAQDLQAMSNIWGTAEGSVRQVGTIPQAEIERRELIMMRCMRHDRFQILTEAPTTQSERVLAVQLVLGGLTRTTNFNVVAGPRGRWYVRSAELEPLNDICRQR